jgi:ankyrin repeat protein
MDQDPQVLSNQLLIAAQNGNNETAKALLMQGAPVDAKDKAGWTPLMLASANNHVDVCMLLLTHGALIDAKNNHGSTPLMLAAIYGYRGVCELLLKHNAQVNEENNGGYTPFMLAAWNGQKDVCKCLIDVMIQKQNKFTKNKHVIIAFLGMRKKNECLKLIGHDMVRYLAQMVFDIVKQDNINAVEQINTIDDDALKIELLNYYQTQLSALQGTQPKECRV